jgi:hypothetical protein
MHYLRQTAFASAVLNVDTNAPRVSFEGTVTEMHTTDGVNYCDVTFDALPDIVIPLRLTVKKIWRCRKELVSRDVGV